MYEPYLDAYSKQTAKHLDNLGNVTTNWLFDFKEILLTKCKVFAELRRQAWGLYCYNDRLQVGPWLVSGKVNSWRGLPFPELICMARGAWLFAHSMWFMLNTCFLLGLAYSRQSPITCCHTHCWGNYAFHAIPPGKDSGRLGPGFLWTLPKHLIPLLSLICILSLW